MGQDILMRDRKSRGGLPGVLQLGRRRVQQPEFKLMNVAERPCIIAQPRPRLTIGDRRRIRRATCRAPPVGRQAAQLVATGSAGQSASMDAAAVGALSLVMALCCLMLLRV